MKVERECFLSRKFRGVHLRITPGSNSVLMACPKSALMITLSAFAISPLHRAATSMMA
jgi:hypothetical protein